MKIVQYAYLFLLASCCAEAATIGTVEDCCCGDELATGSCCELMKHGDNNTCELVVSVDCEFAGGGTSTLDECPETAFECSPDLVCPDVIEKPQAPVPSDELPAENSTCAREETDNGIKPEIASEGDCQLECMTYGVFCYPFNNILLCGSNYDDQGEDDCGNQRRICQCGAGSNMVANGGYTTLCNTLDATTAGCEGKDNDSGAAILGLYMYSSSLVVFVAASLLGVL
mmetsp:Transcript_1747/g.2357  ORF Transcript_1747/g.2357 Transcript_1747/m.2357 type:complete len:228 (-) Transcript_1747:213-896(-)